MVRRLTLLMSMLALAATAGVAQPQQSQGQAPRQGQPPTRDATQTPTGTGSLAGRVLTADTGRPVKRARITASAGGRQSRTTSTDDQGRFQIASLPAGSYTVTAFKNGFVNGTYGQRRPLQPGTPVELAEGRAIGNLDLRLTRGAVITGRVLDEDGEALVRAIVAVERYQYVRGERQLVAAGGGVTDDRGQYRVFGLAPGDYYVNASTPGGPQGPGRGMQAFALAGDGRGGRGFFGGAPDEPDPVGYAPTYYPGVINASDAGKVTVGPGQELEGIDFQAQLVTLATVRGFVVGAVGPVSVLLAPQASGGMRRGQILRGGSQGDGSFSISSVPPGRYTAVARSGGRGGAEKMGTQDVNVTGDNVAGLTIALQPGVSLSGYITIESAGTPAPDDYSTFRVDAPDVSPLPFGGGRGGGPNATGARAQKNGRFQIDNVFPGGHDIRVSGQGAWTLKSVSIGGRDVTDQPIEVRAGQNLDAITIVLTDRTTEITGTVRDGSGSPVADGTVIAFSSDQQYWRPQSRQIQAARTDQSGVFRLRNLPPGDYNLAVVDTVEQGQWFDPAYLEQIIAGGSRISIAEGEKKTQDLRSPAPSSSSAR
jgi:protocatechuate 3,4-dioxygenase beta subunit